MIRRLLAFVACTLASVLVAAQSLPPPAMPLPPGQTPLAAIRWADQLRGSGQHELAVWLAKQALRELSPRDDGAAALNQRVAGWLAEDGRIAEARQWFQRGKEIELLAFVGGAASASNRLPAAVLDAQEQAWSAIWPAGVEVDPASAAARAALADLQALPRSRQAPQRPPPLAASGELHVHALTADASLVIVLDSGSTVRVLGMRWPADQRDREIGTVLTLLQSPAAGDRSAALVALQALYRRIGAALDEAGRSSEARVVVLHVDGALRELPWAALHDGVSFLGERYAFQVASAGRWTGTGAERLASDAPLHIRALGVSRLVSGGDGELSGVAREICAIVAGPVHGLADAACARGAGAIAGEGWLDAAFTAERLRLAVQAGNAGGRALLHLGSHFDLRPGRMTRSTLLLGDGTLLPLQQLAALDFAGHTVVALAACETGVAGTGASESLQALLIQRGAQAVLASVWRVDDASTSQLMQVFYRELANAGPAEALRRAQQSVRSRAIWSSPFFWAGFTLARPS